MPEKRERIWELDALRGFCILCVIFIHFMFDLGFFFGKERAFSVRIVLDFRYAVCRVHRPVVE